MLMSQIADGGPGDAFVALVNLLQGLCKKKKEKTFISKLYLYLGLRKKFVECAQMWLQMWQIPEEQWDVDMNIFKMKRL